MFVKDSKEKFYVTKRHIMAKGGIVGELYNALRKNFKCRHVMPKYLDDLRQADLAEMGAYSPENNEFWFLVTVIDTFSK